MMIAAKHTDLQSRVLRRPLREKNVMTHITEDLWKSALSEDSTAFVISKNIEIIESLNAFLRSSGIKSIALNPNSPANENKVSLSSCIKSARCRELQNNFHFTFVASPKASCDLPAGDFVSIVECPTNIRRDSSINPSAPMERSLMELVLGAAHCGSTQPDLLIIDADSFTDVVGLSSDLASLIADFPNLPVIVSSRLAGECNYGLTLMFSGYAIVRPPFSRTMLSNAVAIALSYSLPVPSRMIT